MENKKLVYPENLCQQPLQSFIASEFVLNKNKYFLYLHINYTNNKAYPLGSKTSLTKKNYDDLNLKGETTIKNKLYKNSLLQSDFIKNNQKTPTHFELSLRAVHNIYCIDIDDKTISWDDIPDILKTCPFTKSRTKILPHFFLKIKGIDNENFKCNENNLESNNLIFAKGELLNVAVWEKIDGFIYNYDITSGIPEFDFNDIKFLFKQHIIDKISKYITDQNNFSDELTTINIWKKDDNVTKDTTDDKETPEDYDDNISDITDFNEYDTSKNDLFRQIYPLYSEERISNYSSWWKLSVAIYNYFGDEQGKILWKEMSSKYNHSKKLTNEIEQQNQQIWNDIIKYSKDEGKKLGFKSLLEAAEQDNKIQYDIVMINQQSEEEINITKNLSLQNMITEMNEAEYARIYFNIKKTKIKLSPDHQHIFLFDNSTTLWRKDNIDKPILLRNDILHIAELYIKKSIKLIYKNIDQLIDNDDKNTKENRNMLQKKLGSMMKLKVSLSKYNIQKNLCNIVIGFLVNKNDVVQFDINKEQHFNIHFQNGVYELKNKLFRKRRFNDYVTKILPYNYVEKDKIPLNIHNEVENFYTKIQPKKEQRDFTLGFLAYCLTGSINLQICKINVGYTASNGKTTEIKIHNKAFPIYTAKLDNNTFAINNKKKHKSILKCLTEPIRLAYMEELDAKFDADFFKDWVDGSNIVCEIMYGTEIQNAIQAKLMTTSNKDFNINVDAGVLRRGKMQMYNSKFVDENEDVEKHIYLKEEGFENKFDNDLYKNAYFHLLINYVDKLVIPKTNTEEFQDVCKEQEADFYDILEENFLITRSKNDFVMKEDICKVFEISTKDTNAFKNISNKLKQNGLTYDKYKQSDNTRGAFFGIKIIIKKHNEDEEF